MIAVQQKGSGFSVLFEEVRVCFVSAARCPIGEKEVKPKMLLVQYSLLELQKSLLSFLPSCCQHDKAAGIAESFFDRLGSC